MKKYISLFVLVIAIMMLYSCNDSSSVVTTNEESAVLDSSIEITEEIITGDITEVPQLISITIPSSYFGDSSEQDIIQAAQLNGYASCVINVDKTVSYQMTYDQQQELLDKYTNEMNQYLEQFINNKEVESFTGIIHADDFSSFVILADTEKYEIWDVLYVSVFSQIGSCYQSIEGKRLEDITVSIRISDSKNENEVLYERIYSDFYSTVDVTSQEGVEKTGTIDPNCVHVFEDTVVAPSHFGNGYTNHMCILCGYSFSDKETEKIIYSISNEKLFDNKGVIIWLENITVNENGELNINLKIDNNTQDDLKFHFEGQINRWVAIYDSTNAEAGKTQKMTITCEKEWLTKRNILSLHKVELEVSATKVNSFWPIDDYEKTLYIYPLGEKDAEIVFEERVKVDGEQVLIESDDYTFVIEGITEEDVIFWYSYNINLIMDNKTNKDCRFVLRNLSVNGTSYSSDWHICDSNTRCISTFTMSDDKLKELKINSIEIIEFSFEIYDNDDYYNDKPPIYTMNVSYSPIQSISIR